MSSIADRLHKIAQAAEEGAQKIGAEIAAHLPAILNDPIVKLVENLALTPAERNTAANIINEVIKLSRGAASLGQPAAPATELAAAMAPVPPAAPAAAPAPGWYDQGGTLPAAQDADAPADDGPADDGAPAGSVPLHDTSTDPEPVTGAVGVPSAG